MRYLFLLLLFLMAIAPSQIVSLDMTNQEIVGLTETTQEAPIVSEGQYQISVRDGRGSILFQTRFAPVAITLAGEEILLEEYDVIVDASASAKVISLETLTGEELDRFEIKDTCGDGVCSIGEKGYCSLDCIAVVFDGEQREVINDEVVESSNWKWFVIGAGILLIIILLLVLHHTSKPHHLAKPPQQFGRY